MTGRQWFTSALILFHVTAVAVAIVPSPGELAVVEPRVPVTGADPVASLLTPWFDGTARVVSRVQSFLYVLARPIRAVTQPYVNAGVRQRWRMFARPPTEDRFLRLDYLVESTPGTPVLRAFSEIVLPVGEDESLRYFRGKAIRNALDAYLRRDFGFLGSTISADESDPRLYRELVPLVRHFRTRFVTQLGSGGTVVRTEVWVGRAAIAPPGTRFPQPVLDARRAVVERYDAGSPRYVSRLVVPRRRALHEEGDIAWSLEYVE